jgi:hypothetical protein
MPAHSYPKIVRRANRRGDWDLANFPNRANFPKLTSFSNSGGLEARCSRRRKLVVFHTTLEGRLLEEGASPPATFEIASGWRSGGLRLDPAG